MAICLKMKSDYSFLSSTISFKDAINFAKKNHQTHLSLIDDNLHGAFEFYNLCIENKIQPIIGIEIQVMFQNQLQPLVLIAKNEIGFKNISKLSYLTKRVNKSYVDMEELALYTKEVIILISTFHSHLSFYIQKELFIEADLYMKNILHLFDYIYLGVYRYKNANLNLINSIKNFIQKYRIKSVAMQYAMHLNVNDTVVLNLLDCIKKNQPANKEFLQNSAISEAYLKNEELLKIYYDEDELSHLNQLIENISLSINKVLFSLPQVFLNPNEELLRQAKNGLKAKKLNEEKEYVERLNYELEVIISMGFANYYLIVADYVNYCKTHDIAVGPSRGSGGASLVAYLLNITTIDPIQYQLIFERFLNTSRSNYPDFDIDFADNKRDLVIQYVKEKYGNMHVAHIAAFSTFGCKSAVRDLGRIMKFTNDDIDIICKSMSNNATSIIDEYNKNDKFKSLLDIHSNFKTLCSLASKIEGLKKQVSLHAAGMILSKEDLTELVPCFEVDENTLAIQYDYIHAEKIGLIKMDFLGLKNLSIIEYCLKRINALTNKKYNLDNFKYDDESAYHLISSLNNIGIFQLESAGINQVIEQLKPNCFDDVVALLALYRPATMSMIHTYIERKNGKKFTYLDESLKEILSSTYGIIIYQEQVMKIAQKLANYTLKEADVFRRAISKKNISLINQEKEKFIQGCINNGFTSNNALKIFLEIEKFASYGFNKAHSVGYGKITTMMAYIKANYSLIFYEALLNVNLENGERRKKIFYEAKRLNVQVLKPSIKHSSLYFSIFENQLIYGLANISSIKTPIAQMILNERAKAMFNSLNDFIIRMVYNDCSLQTLTDLIYAGALDCFNIARKKLIGNLKNLYDYALMFKGLNYQPNTYLDEKYNYILAPLLLFEDQDSDYLKEEYEMLGVYLSTHPLKKYKEKQNVSDIIDIKDDGFYQIIGKVCLIEKRKTKNNADYLNINIEDDTKIINVKNYQQVELIQQQIKKGDIILASISIKKGFNYLNTLKVLEGE